MSTQPVDPTDIDEGDAVGLLSRWSRRKRQAESAPLEREALDQPGTEETPSEDVEPEERIDPRTGKRFSELTDEDMPALDSIRPDSDVSVFMAKNISPALRMKALSKIFHSAKYNKICLCAEYAEDYTSFEPLGDIIPHDLKASIAREAQRLREKLLGQGEEISPEEAQERIWRQTRHQRAADEVPREELEASRWHSHEQRMNEERMAEMDRIAEMDEEQDPENG